MTSDQIVLVVLRLALVALLYLFLAWVVRALWADLRAATQAAGSGAAPRLVFVDGASGGPAAGEIIAVAGTTTIGRAEDNGLVIEDEFISAHHAILRREQSAWWLSDTDSTNGTWANDRKVDRPVVVKTGDTLRFGRLRVRFEA
ncbi:MAG TPA: FHA domain-containing protein [Chloroflexota bacterium]